MVNTNKKVFETVKVFVFKLSRLSEVKRDLKTVERGKLLACHYHAHKYCCDKVVIGQKNLKLLAVAAGADPDIRNIRTGECQISTCLFVIVC